MKALLRYRFLMAKPSCIPASQFQIDRRVNNLGLGNGRTLPTPRSDPRHRLLMLVMVNVDVGVTTVLHSAPWSAEKQADEYSWSRLGTFSPPPLCCRAARHFFSGDTGTQRTAPPPQARNTNIWNITKLWRVAQHCLLTTSQYRGTKIMTLWRDGDTCAISFIQLKQSKHDLLVAIQIFRAAIKSF